MFDDKYINTDDRNKYIDDDGSGIFPKQRVRKLYNAKYQDTYRNRNYVVSAPHIKDTIIQKVFSGRKKRQQVLSIFKVHYIVIMKDHHSLDHVFMIQ